MPYPRAYENVWAFRVVPNLEETTSVYCAGDKDVTCPVMVRTILYNKQFSIPKCWWYLWKLPQCRNKHNLINTPFVVLQHISGILLFMKTFTVNTLTYNFLFRCISRISSCYFFSLPYNFFTRSQKKCKSVDALDVIVFLRKVKFLLKHRVSTGQLPWF